MLTTVEMWSNGITAELAPSYEAAEFDCSASVSKNRARYETLQELDLH